MQVWLWVPLTQIVTFFFLLALCTPFLKQERQRTSKKAYRKSVILTTNFSLYPTAKIHLIQISTVSTVVIPYNKNWYSNWWFIDNIRQGKIKSCAVEGGVGAQCTSPITTWLYELFPGSPTPLFCPSALHFRPLSPHLDDCTVNSASLIFPETVLLRSPDAQVLWPAFNYTQGPLPGLFLCCWQHSPTTALVPTVPPITHTHSWLCAGCVSPVKCPLPQPQPVQQLQPDSNQLSCGFSPELSYPQQHLSFQAEPLFFSGFYVS